MKYLLSAFLGNQLSSYSLCLFDEVDQFTSAVTPPERLDLDDKFHVLLKEGIIILQVLQKMRVFYRLQPPLSFARHLNTMYLFLLRISSCSAGRQYSE